MFPHVVSCGSALQYGRSRYSFDPTHPVQCSITCRHAGQPFRPGMPSSPTPGSSTSICSRQRHRHRPSPRVDRLGTPENPAIRFTRGKHFVASVVRILLRPAKLLAPLNGSDRITPTIGGFYFWASGRSITLPASRYNYSSDWTPLLVRLSPTGMAASLAAPTLASRLPAGHYLGRTFTD
jgi:hypothetical protein